jgi:hypothetical protein
VAGEDPIISGMAGRYATALFELARDNKAVDAVKKDLDQFDALANGSADLNRLMSSSRHCRQFSPRPASQGLPQTSCASSPPIVAFSRCAT